MKLDSLAEPPVVLGLSLATSLALARRSPADAARFAVAAPVAFGISKLLELVAERHPRLLDRRSEQSFPSGHSAVGTAFSLSAAIAMRRWSVLGVAGALVAAINFDRVRKREHWWRDVLVGDAIGAFAAAAGALVARAVRARSVDRARRRGWAAD